MGDEKRVYRDNAGGMANPPSADELDGMIRQVEDPQDDPLSAKERPRVVNAYKALQLAESLGKDTAPFLTALKEELELERIHRAAEKADL